MKELTANHGVVFQKQISERNESYFYRLSSTHIGKNNASIKQNCLYSMWAKHISVIFLYLWEVASRWQIG
jgi:hypothetical protein